MAYIDEERRRRAGIRLTDAREAWLAEAIVAQQEGRSLPPLPTEMTGVRNPGDSDYVTPIGDERPKANQGQRVLSPAYTDPRSQAIAQTPAMIRPAHSMLDKIFRPGRADAANQMNREYKENALTGQMARSGQQIEQRYKEAQGKSVGADAAIKELQRRAMSGGDPEALDSLKKYYEVEALRRGGGNNLSLYTDLANKGPGGLEVVPKAGAEGGGDAPPSEEQPSQRPQETGPVATARRVLRDDFQHGASLALYPEEAIQQAVSKLKARKIKEQQTLSLAKDDLAQHPNHPQTMKYIQKAEARIADIDSKLAEISRPLTSPHPELGDPNRAGTALK